MPRLRAYDRGDTPDQEAPRGRRLEAPAAGFVVCPGGERAVARPPWPCVPRATEPEVLNGRARVVEGPTGDLDRLLASRGTKNRGRPRQSAPPRRRRPRRRRPRLLRLLLGLVLLLPGLLGLLLARALLALDLLPGLLGHLVGVFFVVGHEDVVEDGAAVDRPELRSRRS